MKKRINQTDGVDEQLLALMEARVAEYDGSEPIWWERWFSSWVAVHPWKIIGLLSLLVGVGISLLFGKNTIWLVSWLQGGI